MSEAKFTKGPWIPDARLERVMVAGKNDYSGQICVISDDEYIENNNKFDKHLIASAPELYEELQSDINELTGLLDLYSLGSELHAEICSKLDRKEKLLAKARGE